MGELTTKLKKPNRITKACKRTFKYPYKSGTRTLLSDICALTCRNCPSASPSKAPSKILSDPPTETPTKTSTESPTGDSGCKDDNVFTFSLEINEITATSCAELTTKLKKQNRIAKACKKMFKYPDKSGTRTLLSDICVLTCGNCPSASPSKAPSKILSDPPTDRPTKTSTESPTGGSGCKDDNAFTFSVEINEITATSCAELTTKLKK